MTSITSFAIEPFVGALPLRFGMEPAAVGRWLGPPSKVCPNFLGGTTEFRPLINLAYEDDALWAAAFSPGVALTYDGVDLLTHADPIEFLRTFSRAFEVVGMIVFPDLGVRISGVHDGDAAQKAVEVVRKGGWDELADHFVPYPPPSRAKPAKSARPKPKRG